MTTLQPSMLAAVVTSLEMTTRPPARPLPVSPFKLVRWDKPNLAKYKALFTRMGAPWLWFSRLVMPDDALGALLNDDAVKVFAAVDRDGIEIGMLELDFREPGTCHIAYLALIPELAGHGHGRWLMAHTLMQAWLKDITRVWVHSCTLDHPAALRFYQRAGFTAFARHIETFADPRIAGILPRDSAPHIPLLEPVIAK